MKNQIPLVLMLFFALVSANAVQVSSIDVFPTQTYANFTIILNSTGNASVLYGETIALMQNFSNSTNQQFVHNILVSSLAVDTNYYYKITTCDAENNCTTTPTYLFKTLLIQNVLPASQNGVDLLIFAVILALAILTAVLGLSSKRVFILLISATLFLICAYFMFSGITESFGLATGEIQQVYFDNFYLKAIAVTFVFVSLYLYLQMFSILSTIFSKKKDDYDD